MKKAFPFFFLVIFLFNTAGYYIAFKTEQFEIRNQVESEIKAGINASELTTITISKNETSKIHWLESGEEMEYNGQRYDVVKSSETPSTLTYYCISDSKEESLFTNLDDHINTHVISNLPQKNSKKQIDHVVKLYFSSSSSVSILSPSNRQDILHSDPAFTSILLEINAPPPEFV